MAYATAEDIADRLGRDLDEGEERIVSARLDDVEEMILARIPSLPEKVDDGVIRERLVVMVESEALMRLIKNPAGYTQETDGNYSYSISTRVASGRLEILPEEWALLGIRASVALIAPKIKMPGYGLKKNPNYDFEAGIFPMYACETHVDGESCGCPGYTDCAEDTAVWG